VGSRRHTSIAAPHRLLVSITLIHSQIGVLNLDRAMGNAKTFFHRLLRSQERLATTRHVLDDKMATQRVKARSQRPDVQIVHCGHARQIHKLPFQQANINFGRSALHQYMDGAFQQYPSAWHNEEPNACADDRVSQRPAGQQHHCCGKDYSNRAKHVSQHFKIRTFEIQTFPRAGVQHLH